MKKETRQPKIEVPIPEEDISWAALPATRTERIRVTGAELALDSNQLVIGYVLASIVGDDRRAFGLDGSPSLNAVSARLSKEKILTRLRWEWSIDEIPGDLKILIEQTIRHIERFDFSKPNQFAKAKITWIFFKEEVEKIIKETPKLKAAQKYYEFQKYILDSCWDEVCERR